MKKLIPLALALLLLAACGTETPPAESVEPASPHDLVTPPPQTPPAEPADETPSRELPEGFALPQEEFEPAAFWEPTTPWTKAAAGSAFPSATGGR